MPKYPEHLDAQTIKSVLHGEMYMKCIKAVMFFTSTHPFLLFRKISVNISVTLTAVVYGLSNCLFLL